MAQDKNGTSNFLQKLILVFVLFGFVLGPTVYLLGQINEANACAQRADLRVNILEKNVNEIKDDVKDIKNFLMKSKEK